MMLSSKGSEREKNQLFPEYGGKRHIRAQCVQCQNGVEIYTKCKVINIVMMMMIMIKIIIIIVAYRSSPNPSQLT